MDKTREEDVYLKDHMEMHGFSEYCYRGLVHRRDGPAVMWKNEKWWVLYGEDHRNVVDGPSVISLFLPIDTNAVKDKEYWVHGMKYTEGNIPYEPLARNHSLIKEEVLE